MILLFSPERLVVHKVHTVLQSARAATETLKGREMFFLIETSF
jgi:hypothetical protein